MNDIVITEFLEPDAVDVLKRDFKVHWDRELWTKRATWKSWCATCRA